MMLIARMLAQLVDLFAGFAILIGSFLIISPVLYNAGLDPMLIAVLMMIAVVLLIFGMQYPFMRVNQSVGKAFFRLEIVTTDRHRPLTVSILVQREVFLKLFTCFFICLPVLWGKPGWHEISTETKVVWKSKTQKQGGSNDV